MIKKLTIELTEELIQAWKLAIEHERLANGPDDKLMHLDLSSQWSQITFELIEEQRIRKGIKL